MTSPEYPDWQALALAVETQMCHSRARGCPEREVLPVALALVFAGWMPEDTATRYIEAHTVVDRHNRSTAERDRDEARRERDAARQEAADRCARLIRDRVWQLNGKHRQEGARAAAGWLTAEPDLGAHDAGDNRRAPGGAYADEQPHRSAATGHRGMSG